jgi:hypothetical protein
MPTPIATLGAAKRELPASNAIAINFVFIFVPPFNTCHNECRPSASANSLNHLKCHALLLATGNRCGGFGPCTPKAKSFLA